MRKVCADCGAGFEAKRTTAKYCSARCRVRAGRRPDAPAAAERGQMPPDPDFEVESATLAELNAAGRASSAAGKAALALARRIDAGQGETGASLAAMVREHRAAMADAVKDAAAAANPLDELRARRDRIRAG